MKSRWSRKTRTQALFSVFIVLACACGSDDDDDSNQGVQTAPSLGLVRNADVTFEGLDGGILGTGKTDSQTGLASVNVTSDAPIVIRLKGNDQATYYDEAAASFVAFPASAEMHAIVPPGKTQVAVTPLTELAYQLAKQAGLSRLNADAIDKINKSVADQWIGGGDITAPPTLVNDQTGATLGSAAADRYALVLAALAQVAHNAQNNRSILDLLVDLQDGAVDGKNGASAIDVAYNASTTAALVTSLHQAVDTQAEKYATAELKQVIAELKTSIKAGTIDVTSVLGQMQMIVGNGVTKAATVTPALAGSYELTYHSEVAGGPHANGNKITFEITSQNQLKFASKTLTQPFYRSYGGTFNEAEIIWLDPATKIEYAVSDNTVATAHFNEINIGDASMPHGDAKMPKFLGQFREPTPPPDLTKIKALKAVYSMRIASPINLSGFQGFEYGKKFSITIGEDGTVKSGDEFISFGTAGHTYQNFYDQQVNPYIGWSKSINATDSDELRIYINHLHRIRSMQILFNRSVGNGNTATTTVTLISTDAYNVLEHFKGTYDTLARSAGSGYLYDEVFSASPDYSLDISSGSQPGGFAIMGDNNVFFGTNAATFYSMMSEGSGEEATTTLSWRAMGVVDGVAGVVQYVLHSNMTTNQFSFEIEFATKGNVVFNGQKQSPAR